MSMLSKKSYIDEFDPKEYLNVVYGSSDPLKATLFFIYLQ